MAFWAMLAGTTTGAVGAQCATYGVEPIPDHGIDWHWDPVQEPDTTEPGDVPIDDGDISTEADQDPDMEAEADTDEEDAEDGEGGE